MPLSRHLPPKSHVLWLISLIQDTSPHAQTKAEFAEMASDIIETDAIDKITLCIGDNLQRFRFMIQNDCTEAEGIEICQQLSRQWHIDNQDSIEKLRINKNLEFIKWDEFLVWPDYAITVRAVEDLYLRDTKFKKAVDGRIRQELHKISSTAKITDLTKQTELLKKYLFEESAFQKFVASKGFKFQLYKNAFPPPAKCIINNSDFVPPGYLSEIHFTQYQHTQKNNPLDNSPQSYNSLPLNIQNGNNVVPLQQNSHKNETYGSVLSQPNSYKQHKSERLSESPEKKFANFIESTLALLPAEQRLNAIKDLFQFTTQKIIPLCYENNTNALVI